MLVFGERGKPECPGKKPLIAEQRTKKLNPHLTPSAEIEPGPHWWQVLSPLGQPCHHQSTVAYIRIHVLYSALLQIPITIIHLPRLTTDQLFIKLMNRFVLVSLDETEQFIVNFGKNSIYLFSPSVLIAMLQSLIRWRNVPMLFFMDGHYSTRN